MNVLYDFFFKCNACVLHTTRMCISRVHTCQGHSNGPIKEGVCANIKVPFLIGASIQKRLNSQEVPDPNLPQFSHCRAPDTCKISVKFFDLKKFTYSGISLTLLQNLLNVLKISLNSPPKISLKFIIFLKIAFIISSKLSQHRLENNFS